MAEEKKRPGPLDPQDILAKLEMIKQQVQQSMPEFEIPQPEAPEAPAKPAMAEPKPVPSQAAAQAPATTPPAAVAPSAPAAGGTSLPAAAPEAPADVLPVTTGYKSFLEYELVADLSNPEAVKQVEELTQGRKLKRMAMDYTAGVKGALPPSVPGDKTSNADKVIKGTRTATSREYDYTYRPGEMLVMTKEGKAVAVIRVKGNYRITGRTADGQAVLLNRATGETTTRPIAELAASEGYEASAYGKRIYGAADVKPTQASEVIKPTDTSVSIADAVGGAKTPGTPETKPSVAEIGLPEASAVGDQTLQKLTTATTPVESGRQVEGYNIVSSSRNRGRGYNPEVLADMGAITNATFGRFPLTEEEAAAAIGRKPNPPKGYQGKPYQDIESWYQGNKTGDSAADEAMLQRLIEAKYAKYPEIVAMIDKYGGVDFLEASTHEGTGKPDWEGKGSGSKTIKMWIDAYNKIKGGTAPEKTTTAPSAMEPAAPKKGKGKKTEFVSDKSTSNRWPDRPAYTLPQGERYLAVVGTSGRQEAGARLVADDFSAMVDRVSRTVRPTDVLISGGAAWADHVAVQLFLDGKVGGLVLHLPGELMMSEVPGETPRMQFDNGGFMTSGSTANLYHDQFATALGLQPGDTIAQLQQAIDKGAVVTFGNGASPTRSSDAEISSFIARNRWIAQDATSGMITLSFDPTPNGPNDGGSGHAVREHKRWNPDAKQFHLDIRKIRPDDTEPERIAKYQGVQESKALHREVRDRMITTARVESDSRSEMDRLKSQIRGTSGEYGGQARVRRLITATRQGKLLGIAQRAILPEHILASAAQLQGFGEALGYGMSQQEYDAMFPEDGSKPRIPNPFWESSRVKNGKVETTFKISQDANMEAGLSMLRHDGLFKAFWKGVGPKANPADKVVLQALKALGVPEETFAGDYKYRPRFALNNDPEAKIQKLHDEADLELDRRVEALTKRWAKLRKYADHPDIALPVHTLTMLLRGLESDMQSEIVGGDRTKDMAPATAELQRTRARREYRDGEDVYIPYRRSLFDAQIPGTFVKASNEIMAATENLSDDPLARYLEIQRLTDPAYIDEYWKISGKPGFEYDVHQETSLYGGTVDTNPGYRRYVMDMDGLVPQGWMDLDERGLVSDEFEGFQNRFSTDGYEGLYNSGVNTSRASIAFHVSTDPSASIPPLQRSFKKEARLNKAIKALLGKEVGGLRHGTTDYETIMDHIIPYTRDAASVIKTRDGLRSRVDKRIVAMLLPVTDPPGFIDALTGILRIGSEKYKTESDASGMFIEIEGRKIYYEADSITMAFFEGDPVVEKIKTDPELARGIITEPFNLGDKVKWPGEREGYFKVDIDPIVHQTFRHTSPLVRADGRAFQGTYVPAIPEYVTPELDDEFFNLMDVLFDGDGNVIEELSPADIGTTVYEDADGGGERELTAADLDGYDETPKVSLDDHYDNRTGTTYTFDQFGNVIMENGLPSTHVFDDFSYNYLYEDGIRFAIASEVAPGLTVDGVDLIERLLSESEYDMLRRGQIDLRDVVGEYINTYPYKRGVRVDLEEKYRVINPETGEPFIKKVFMPEMIERNEYAPAAIPQQVAYAGETGAAVTAKQEQGLPSRLLSDREMDYEALVLQGLAENHFGQPIRADIVDSTIAQAAATSKAKRETARVRSAGYEPMAEPVSPVLPANEPVPSMDILRETTGDTPLPEAVMAERAEFLADYVWLLRARATDAARMRQADAGNASPLFRKLALARTKRLAAATKPGQYRDILFSHAQRVASPAFASIAVNDILRELNDDPLAAEPIVSIFKKVYDSNMREASTREGLFSFDTEERKAARNVRAAQETLRRLTDMQLPTQYPDRPEALTEEGRAALMNEAYANLREAQERHDALKAKGDTSTHETARRLAKEISRSLLLERSANPEMAVSIDKIYQQLEDDAQMSEETFQREADQPAPAEEFQKSKVTVAEVERIMMLPVNERGAAIEQLKKNLVAAKKAAVVDPMAEIRKSQEGVVKKYPDPIETARQTLAKAKESLKSAKADLKKAKTQPEQYAAQQALETKKRLVSEASARLAYAEKHTTPTPDVVEPQAKPVATDAIRPLGSAIERYIKSATPEQLAELRDETWMLLSQHMAADGDYDSIVKTLDSYLRLGNSNGKSIAQGMNIVFDNDGVLQIPSDLLSYKNDAGADVHLRPEVSIPNPNLQTAYTRKSVIKDFIPVEQFASFLRQNEEKLSPEAYNQLVTIMQYVTRVNDNPQVDATKKLGFWLGSPETIGKAKVRRVLVATAPKKGENGQYWASQQEATTPYNAKGASFDSDYLFNEGVAGRASTVTADAMETTLRELGVSDIFQVVRRGGGLVEGSLAPRQQKDKAQPFDVDITGNVPMAKEIMSQYATMLSEGEITQQEFDVILKHGLTWDDLLKAIDDPVIEAKGQFGSRFVAYKMFDAAIRARFAQMFEVVLRRAGVDQASREVAVPQEWRSNNPFELDPETFGFKLRKLDADLEHAAGPFTLKDANWHKYSWEEEAFRGNPVVKDFISRLRRGNTGINPVEAEQMAAHLEQILEHRQQATLAAEALGSEPLPSVMGKWMPKIGAKGAIAGGTIAGTFGAYLLAKSEEEKKMALAGAPVQAGFEVLSRAVGGAPAAAAGLGLTYTMGGDMLRALTGMAGSLAGGFLGGAAGLVGGPVGGFAGGLAGSTAGWMAADTLYSAIAGDHSAPMPANVGQAAPQPQVQMPVSTPQQPQQVQAAAPVDTSTALGQAKMLEGI
jgi:hypothetical protein